MGHLFLYYFDEIKMKYVDGNKLPDKDTLYKWVNDYIESYTLKVPNRSYSTMHYRMKVKDQTVSFRINNIQYLCDFTNIHNEQERNFSQAIFIPV